MFIAKNNEWDESHTGLSKYFIEKIKQQVDYQESISNQHKSTNGYTLIKEIVDVSNLTIKREKSIYRLISLVIEAKSAFLMSSILNDYILNKYYSDIVEFYKELNPQKLKNNQKNVSDLLNKSLINYKRIKDSYFNNIISEIRLIDFKSTEFKRNAKTVDKLISCAVPYLIHRGYSTQSISDISYNSIKSKQGDKSPIRIFNKFRNQDFNFEFIIKTSHDGIEEKTICEYLCNKEVPFTIVENYADISSNFFDDIHTPEAIYILINRRTIDPHNYLRNLYEVSLKKHVISKSRQDLSSLNDFFERVFWRFKDTEQKFQKSNFNLDPLNVHKRKTTLSDTLKEISKSNDFEFNDQSEIPYIPQISESLYYYNLAIGSKSIENSMSLLWTSLETLLPYRLKENDIENVQYFVSKMLSIGSIGREVVSFIRRYSESNWINKGSLDNIVVNTNFINYENRLGSYFDFLSKEFDDSNDPFTILNESSSLLASEFCRLNDIYVGKNKNTVEYWINKIKHSEQSIEFQLDRIYLHRNQIVHSGKFVNEYSNLWNHLEWYVGKLLSYCVLEYIALEDKDKFDKKEIFMELEAYIDNIKNSLNSNKEKKIKDIKKLALKVLMPTWQFM